MCHQETFAVDLRIPSLDLFRRVRWPYGRWEAGGMDRMDDIARWLVNDAPHHSVKALFAAFCQEIVRSGAPVWRTSLGLEVLHPEVSGWHHVWTNENLSVQAA